MVQWADDRVRQGREAKLERLILAVSDMGDAADAARFLRSALRGDEGFVSPHVQRALLTGLFVSYARPFTRSRGNPRLPVAPTTGLSTEEQTTHKWALAERDRVWAHSEREGHRRVVQFQEAPAPGSVASLQESFEPPSLEDIAKLGELADSLHERYCDQAIALGRELASEA